MVFVEGLYDAVIDCLKVMPILFLAYLLVSFLSHDHSHKFSRFLSKNKKTSVLYASFLGCVPQCGFSSVLADLYSKRTVSLGTLIAVFVGTSDEAIPIMIADPTTKNVLSMLLLVGVKIALALFWGYLIELIVKAFSNKRTLSKKQTLKRNVNYKNQKTDEKQISFSTKNTCGHIHTDSCDGSCGHNHGNCCANNIFLDAFMHTFNIMIYIFIATLVINLIVGYFGLDVLQNLLTTNVYLQILIASLVGLIPNCASSVLLVELYVLYGTLSFPALIAGLTAGAGVGLVVLWGKNRKRPLENFGILGLQYLIGVISGLFLTIFF